MQGQVLLFVIVDIIFAQRRRKKVQFLLSVSLASLSTSFDVCNSFLSASLFLSLLHIYLCISHHVEAVWVQQFVGVKHFKVKLRGLFTSPLFHRHKLQPRLLFIFNSKQLKRFIEMMKEFCMTTNKQKNKKNVFKIVIREKERDLNNLVFFLP